MFNGTIELTSSAVRWELLSSSTLRPISHFNRYAKLFFCFSNWSDLNLSWDFCSQLNFSDSVWSTTLASYRTVKPCLRFWRQDCLTHSSMLPLELVLCSVRAHYGFCFVMQNYHLCQQKNRTNQKTLHSHDQDIDIGILGYLTLYKLVGMYRRFGEHTVFRPEYWPVFSMFQFILS